MRKLQTLLLVSVLVINASLTHAQEPAKITIYNPNANARADLKEAIAKASAENKHVLIQVGGNWCTWCVKMHNLFHSNTTIDSLLRANYIWVHLNYSKENKNLSILQELEYPQRFGFPVLVILDKTGKRLHTQDTSLLESGDGYDVGKIVGFLKGWIPDAVDPKNY
jgi:thioredoxin-related protein